MRRFGLPKQCLLKKNADFESVYRHGKRLHGKGFSLIFVDRGCGNSRIGISISRKIKGAVVRNRIKRICKESFRLNRQLYPRNADIVITIRPDFSLDKPQLITREVARLLSSESR